MDLDKRLATLAALAPQGARLADIGTDHAYLPVHLVKEGRVERAIASDVLPGPCRAAEKTIREAELTTQIEVRCGDGLATLQPGEADTIVLAGMGGPTMTAILERSPEVLAQAKCLLLQPMGGAATVRRWLYEHGWFIEAEELVVERDHWYEILAAHPGKRPCPREALLWLGPILTEKRHPLLREYALAVVGRLQKALASMRQGKNTEEKQTRYRLLIETIDEEMKTWRQ